MITKTNRYYFSVAFKDWKRDIQVEGNFAFAKRTTINGTRYYECGRSGFHNPVEEPENNPRSRKDTLKIGGTCPCSMVSIFNIPMVIFKHLSISTFLYVFRV